MIRTALRIALTEYRRYIQSTKLLVFFVVFVFIQTLISQPLIQCALDMNSKLSLFEPFMALCSSWIVMLVVPFGFIAMTADFPKGEEIDLFLHVRTNKRTWALGQLIFLFIFVITYILALLLVSCIMICPYCRWDTEYSTTIKQYALYFPEKSGGLVNQLISGHLYNQLKLIPSVLHSMGFMALYLIILGLVLLIAAVNNVRKAGLVINIVLLVLGTVTSSISSKLMWFFPMAHTVTWMHFKEYLRQPVFPIWGSYLYLGGITVILIVIIMVRARCYQVGTENNV